MSRTKTFVIHEHDASTHHYDLLLQMDGVLKSWAVSKRPPEEKGVRRLAIQVEDHPLDYADFEGEIPEGHYGAGTVKIWDKGSYDLVDRSDERIVFKLSGRRLGGTYVLLKFRKAGENKWLLFRGKI